MASGSNLDEVAKALNDLKNERSRMIFLGGNYEYDEGILGDIGEVIEEIDLIPIIAKDVFEVVDPHEIHGESLRLLHNCGFAVIDVTNPAGQLMELERARDYGVTTFVSYRARHLSKMIITLSKVMENWGLGYLFNPDHPDGLKKFVKNILLINHSKNKRAEEIIETIIGKKPEKLLLLTSIGVLNPEECKNKVNEIKNLLKNIESKIIITGWDFKTRGREEMERYGAETIICEGCILYTKYNDEIAKKEFCDENSLRLVKVANKHIIYTISDYVRMKELGHAVFFSQADEKSICYYLNPPNTIREKLEQYKERTPCEIEKFVEKVETECRQKGDVDGDEITYTKPNDSQAEESLLYATEKTNAIYRTLCPYSVTIEDDKIIVNLNPTNGYTEFSYRDLENVVETSLRKMSESDYEHKINYQKDICIDILCKSKDEILVPSLQEVVDDLENTLIIYLSKGTESDIPMIFEGYSSKYNFIAIGTDNTPERLKRAGVIPLGESVTTTIRNILGIYNRLVAE